MQIRSMSFATMCAMLFLTTTAFSQVKATTYDGKEVVLHEDGTWEYVDKTDEAPNTSEFDCEPRDCACWIKEEVDRMTGKVNIGARETLVISDDGVNGFGIYPLKAGKAIILSITAVGAGSCIDKGDKINVLFRDGSRLELASQSDFNCDANATLYFGGSFGNRKQRDQLITKKIETMRVWTSDSYVQQDFTEEQSTAFREIFTCLVNH